MASDDDRIEKAAREVREFGVGSELTTRIADIEAALVGCSSDQVPPVLESNNVDLALLESALEVKALSGQINVLIHAAGTEHPLRFLANNRALSSVLSKNISLAERFRDLHGEDFGTVSDYWETVKDRVEVIDLREVVPTFGKEHLDAVETS